ncbi:MAG: AIM24 family protein [Candidatus Nanopelagicales bacterium]
MQVEIEGSPAFAARRGAPRPVARCGSRAARWPPTAGDVEILTSTQGGLCAACAARSAARASSSDDFTSKTGGTVGVAAVLPGDLAKVSVSGQELMVASGSWIASDTIDVDSKWGGAKGFFGERGLVLLRHAGQGDLLISSYGALRYVELPPGERITIDNGHIVAFNASISYNVRKAAAGRRRSSAARASSPTTSAPAGSGCRPTTPAASSAGWTRACAPRLPALASFATPSRGTPARQVVGSPVRSVMVDVAAARAWVEGYEGGRGARPAPGCSAS